ncbi:alpha/beta fold hydrolase [Glycomyces sp. NPDC046736]|uniref:alpha/beta fold hydrolase n=1 Tax=Glycomyces sp. NPDC046736 TaxID=3155615 RepID=UPI0033D1D0DC
MALHVNEWGAGDRVAVLIHGLSTSSRSWSRLAPELARRGYRVLAPDLAGHGKSPRGAYSREAWADDLAASLPGGPELAIGHSLGAVLLAMLAERLAPGRAVYLDPAWYPWQGIGYGAAQEGIRSLKDLTTDELALIHSGWSEEEIKSRRAELDDWDPETTRMRYLETAYVPVYPVVPSLILRADGSELVPAPLADHFTDVGFKVRTVPGTGHFVHNDDLAGTLAALEGWV